MKKNRIFATSNEQKANQFLFHLARTSPFRVIFKRIIEKQSKHIDLYV